MRRSKRARSPRSTSSPASFDRSTRRRSIAYVPRPRSYARADGWCGRRRTCWPTASQSASSPRPGSASPSTRSRTSPSREPPVSEPGPEVMARFVGEANVERGRAYLESLDPELHRYIIDFVYGEVYAGDGLDAKTRALCTVAMLATLGQQLQLGVYVRAAHRQGATEEEIREVLRQVAVYAGFPNAWNALATMKRALEGLPGTGTEPSAGS